MRGTLKLDSREHWAWPAYAFLGGPPADERVATAVIGPTSVLRQEVRWSTCIQPVTSAGCANTGLTVGYAPPGCGAGGARHRCLLEGGRHQPPTRAAAAGRGRCAMRTLMRPLAWQLVRTFLNRCGAHAAGGPGGLPADRGLERPVLHDLDARRHRLPGHRLPQGSAPPRLSQRPSEPAPHFARRRAAGPDRLL